MKLGLIGLPRSGRKTVFEALTGKPEGSAGGSQAYGETRVQTVTVNDERLRLVADVYKPKKTTPARIEYWLPADIEGAPPAKAEAALWSQIRLCDGVLHVVRNFPGLDGAVPDPEKDYRRLEEEMILADLAVTEKRMERIELDRKRGKKPEGGELELLSRCHELLDRGEPLRDSRALAGHPALSGFAFLTAKPVLMLINNDDEDETRPVWDSIPPAAKTLVMRARLEGDIAAMSPEEAEEFREAYHIPDSALDRVIRTSLELLDRITFFTVNEEEAKAWPVRAGAPALEAAGAVHTDIQRGFIRAEVLPVQDLQKSGTVAEAKRAGLVRLEGKEYVVQDGDIIYFRFNV